MSFSARTIANHESATIQARGRSYRARVSIISKIPGIIAAKVHGSHLYKTTIWKNKAGDYIDECSCPYGATCKHSIALAYVIEADNELRSVLDYDEKSKEKRIIQDAEIVHEEKTSDIILWLEELQKTKQNSEKIVTTPKKNEGVYYQFSIDVEKEWNRKVSDEQFLAISVGRYTFSKNLNRVNFGNTYMPDSLLRRNPAYLTELDRKILQIICYCQKDYYSYNPYDLVRLDSVALEEVWKLLQQAPHVIFQDRTPLQLFPKPIDFSLTGKLTKNGLTWKPQLLHYKENVLQGNISQIFFYEPPVIFSSKHILYRLRNVQNATTLRTLLDNPFISHQALQKPDIVTKLITTTGYAPILLPQEWITQAQNEIPKPIIILDTKTDPWQIDIFFHYKNKQFSTSDTNILYVLEHEGKTLIHKRNLEEEKSIVQEFKKIIKTAEKDTFPLFLTEQQQKVFFTETLYQFPQEWDVLLMEEKEKIERSKQEFAIEQSSGIDWLEISGTLKIDEKTLSLFDLLEQFMSERPLIKLNNRTHLLDKNTIQTLKKLQLLYSKKDKKIKLHRTSLGMIDSLQDIVDTKKLHKSWQQSITALRNFKKINEARLPKVLHAELRPYQKEGINWLHFLREFSFGGILADDMGLGKTLQALTLLAYTHEQLKKPTLSLIVAPTSVVYNWQSEMEKFTPSLKPYVYIGKERKLPEPNEADVVITSYALLWRDQEKLANIHFHYVILDEAQYIKNHTAKTAQAARNIQTDHKLSITGTPIENNLLELWSQFSFALPGLFGSKEDFTNKFIIPIERDQNSIAQKQLQQLIKPFLLRRTKEQVMKELPPKIEQTIWCDMEEKQAKLYAIFMKYYQAKIGKLLDTQGVEKSHIQILEALLRLRQICCHPKLLKLDKQKLSLHLPKDLQGVSHSAKLESVMELIETAIEENHKILIFSQFVEMLHLIENELTKRKIQYLILTGQTKNRQEVIKLFQEKNDHPVFLLSLKAGGTGLNLTAADYVIHYDPWWNPAVEMQATDRAHRIGQNKTVSVYKMLVRNSIEEKIQILQNKKKDLIDNLITGTSGNKRLTKDDIAFLFQH